MEPSTDRSSAEAAEFVEQCHRALRQHTGGKPAPVPRAVVACRRRFTDGGSRRSSGRHSRRDELLTAAAKTLNYENLGRREPRHCFRRYARFTVELERLTRRSTARRRKCR